MLLNHSGSASTTTSAVNGASYVYDGNGNLTSGAGRIVTWDSENRPASTVDRSMRR